jgi:rhodanese-related sulfurtransferase
MSVKQIDPNQAYAALQEDNNTVYIDVRTPEEFAAGHVPGAVNIAVMSPDSVTRRMSPNPGFLAAVEGRFLKEQRIICGCQMGGRSQYAAEQLSQAGFQDVANMQGGFGGARDPMGRLVAPGWLQSSLPIEK